MTAATRARVDDENPWPGLSAFDEGSKRFFNGRGHEVTELRRLVLNSPLTVLFGTSGLGKTSLVQAGLFPVLRREQLPVYIRLDVRERGAPLIEQVRRALEEQIRARQVDAPAFHGGESLWEYLHRDGLELWSDMNQLLAPLFVFDQFEEVFTLGSENMAAIAKFRVDLADLVENRIPGSLAEAITRNEASNLSLDSQRYRVLISFREDFLPAVEAWKRELPSILRNRLRLLPMSGEQAFEAIHTTAPNLADEPIAREIVRFIAAAQEEAGVAQAGGESIGELSVEPALLSLLCHGLNQKRKAAGKPAFDEALLRGAGQSIISDFYRTAVGDLPEGVQRFIECELITERGFRNSCDVDDAVMVHGVTKDELRLLVDRRVLRIEPQRRGDRVELTHDLLTRVVREDRDRQRARSRVSRQRRRVAILGLIGSGLAALVVMFYLMYRNSETQRNALERQKAETDQALISERVARERLNIASTDLQATLGQAQALVKSEKEQREVAQQKTRVALSHQLATASLNAVRTGDGDAGISFALGAVDVTRKVDGTVLPSAEDALRQAAPARGVPLVRPGHTAPISRAVFSRDGNRVATIGADAVRIWDLSSGEETLAIPGGCDAVFSPDWKLMACLSSAQGGESPIWSLETGEIVDRISSFLLTHSRAGGITKIVFSPDGKARAAGDETRTWFWKEAGKPIERPGAHPVFSPDGKYLATTEGNQVHVWDIQTAAEIRSVDQGRPVSSVAFSTDGRWLAAAGVGMVRLWDWTKNAPSRDLPSQPGLAKTCIADSTGECELRFTIDNKGLLIRAVGGEVLAPVSGGDNTYHLAFSADAKRWIDATDASATVFAGAEVNPVATLRPGGEAWKAAVFSPDRQRLVTAEGNGIVRLWSTASGKPIKTMTGHTAEVTALAYSPDGKLIASAGIEPIAKLWDGVSGRFLRDLHGHTNRILGLAFSPDSERVATAGYDNSVRVWDANSGADLTKNAPIQFGLSVFSVAFSPDGNRIAAAGYGKASLWDSRLFKKLADIPVDGAQATTLLFSPDGSRLLAVTDRGLQLWKPATSATVLPGGIRNPSPTASLVGAFSHDGRKIASGGTDGTVRLWDFRSLTEYRSFYGNKDYSWAVGFDSKESKLLAFGNDGALYRHPLKLAELIKQARVRRTRELTNADCEKYLREGHCPVELDVGKKRSPTVAAK